MPRYQSSSHGHSKHSQHLQHKANTFNFAFYHRTIPAWNALASEVVEADSQDLFKRQLNQPRQFRS